jgi:HEAT repeat protein
MDSNPQQARSDTWRTVPRESSPNGNYVFLSYRSIERGFVLKLMADLKDAGVNVWTDVFGIAPGQKWDSEVSVALDRCASALVVLSPAYVHSEICMNELERLRSHGKGIVPILLAKLRPDELPLVIQRTQYMDFTNWRSRESYEQQLSALLSILRERVGEGFAQTPDPETKYLNSLVHELQSTFGVADYIEMEAVENGVETTTPDEWAFDVLLDFGKPARQTRRLGRINELIVARPHLVLLGQPGMGKTTVLRRIGLLAAKTRIAGGPANPIPLLIHLKQWTQDTHFADFLSLCWPFSSRLDEAVAAGTVLLLLDGLNEIRDDGAVRAAQVRDYLGLLTSKARVIVSCRTQDYARFELDDDFVTVELCDLTDDQIRQLATCYLGHRASTFIDEVLPRDERTRSDVSVAISVLARNTYLLIAFILLFQQSPAKALPGNTGLLFSRLTNAIWTREERRKYGESNRPDTWQASKGRLAALALWMTEHRTADLIMPEIVSMLGGEDLFQSSLDAGILVRNGSYASFYHDLLKAYFCAEALLALGDIGQISDWCRKNPLEWETVIVAWSGLTESADEFLADQHWQDAAQIVARGFAASAPGVHGLVNRAMVAFDLCDTRQFQPVANGLLCLGRHVVPHLLERCSSEVAGVRERAAFVLGYLADPRSVEALVTLVDDSAESVRDRAQTAIVQIGLGDWQRALMGAHHSNPGVRRAAARTLINVHPADSNETLFALANDTDRFVRVEGLKGLATIGDGRAIDPLLSCTTDDNEWIRTTAIEGLSLLSGAQAAVAIVAGLNDAASTVRAASAEALGSMGDPAFVSDLLGHLADPDDRVRSAVARSIGTLGDDRAISTLRELLCDRDPCVGSAAAAALRKLGWIPGTVHDQVRLFVAIENWATCLDLGPEAIPALCECLLYVDDRRAGSIGDVLRKLQWQPVELRPEVFRFCVAAADWDAEAKQFADYRLKFEQNLLYLPEWLGKRKIERTPLFTTVTNAIQQCRTPICGETLAAGLLDTDVRIRLVATLVAEIGRCPNVGTYLLDCLDCLEASSWHELPTVRWQLRIAAAGALGEIGESATSARLLRHVSKKVANGNGFFSDSSALAAVQAFSRITSSCQIFYELPGALVGDETSELVASVLNRLHGYQLDESVVDALTKVRLDSKGLIGWARRYLPEPFMPNAIMYALESGRANITRLFWLQPNDETPSANIMSVAEVIDAIDGDDDQREYFRLRNLFGRSDGVWILHRKLAILTLLNTLSATREFVDLARDALACFADETALPVLVASRKWPRLEKSATAELVRRCRDNKVIL